jgi:hypothetical protein
MRLRTQAQYQSLSSRIPALHAYQPEGIPAVSEANLIL